MAAGGDRDSVPSRSAHQGVVPGRDGRAGLDWPGKDGLGIQGGAAAVPLVGRSQWTRGLSP